LILASAAFPTSALPDKELSDGCGRLIALIALGYQNKHTSLYSFQYKTGSNHYSIVTSLSFGP
jgi:hypothetical protein